MRKVDLLKKIKETNEIEHKIFMFKRQLSIWPFEIIRGKAFSQVDIFNWFFSIVPLRIFRYIEYDVGFTLSSSERLEVTEKVLEEL